MAKKLVKKAAPAAVVETDEQETAYPEQSPTGASLVFVDDAGVAHYQDGSRFEVEDEEVETEDDEAEEYDEDDDEEVESEEDEADDESEEVEEDDESDEPDDAAVEKNASPGAAYSTKKKSKKVKQDQGYTDTGIKNSVVKSVHDVDHVALDALRLSTALVDEVREIFSTTDLSKREEAYENAMLNFNRVMDTAALQNWLAGSSVSKSDNANAVDEAVEAITKTYTTVVENVGGTVSKSDEKTDIYKGLTPEAAEIVRKSADVLEERETEKWESVAKGFKNVPGDKGALGAALRALNEADPEKYKAVAEALGAADAGLQDSEVFKSFGRPGTDTTVSKAQELVSKGEAKTLDEAELLLIERNPGEFYTPTNSNA